MRTRIAIDLLAAAVLLGCGATTPSSSFTASIEPGAISCQPLGFTPAPVHFSFAPGPVTSTIAEQTAIALVRSCGSPAYPITELTSKSEAATGARGGPNLEQPVWRVQVDSTISNGSQLHFLIEVNQATGVPTLVGYG